jgi:hypothetical protein
MKRDQLALRLAQKLWGTPTLNPILRKLRSVLMSVDMAALYVSLSVPASREALIDDAKSHVNLSVRGIA